MSELRMELRPDKSQDLPKLLESCEGHVLDEPIECAILSDGRAAISYKRLVVVSKEKAKELIQHVTEV